MTKAKTKHNKENKTKKNTKSYRIAINWMTCRLKSILGLPVYNLGNSVIGRILI